MFSVRYRFVFIVLLGVYSYLNILFTGGNLLFGIDLPALAFGGLVLLQVALIWELNRWLQNRVPAQPRVGKRPVHPLLVHFATSLLLVFVLALVPVWVLHELLDPTHDLGWLPFQLSIGFSFRINLFLHCVNAIVFYMEKYKRAQVQTEQLKKQNVEARFDALRHQVNPHFLFNSFNVLSTLVYRDADAAARFIDQLSNVYRYLLSNQDQKLIRLKEELDFLESYLFLLKVRFQDNLRIEVQVPDPQKDYFIAPATLQLLIENAIKHNVVSKKEPLHIRIFAENGIPGAYKLVVENNLQPKRVTEPSTRLGLRNIQNRYEFLVGRNAVEIVREPSFTVKIPLLQLTPER